MSANVRVKIPERCFISPNPEKEFPSAFSFVITYGQIPEKECRRLGAGKAQAVKYPQITVSGMDKLLLDPEEIESFMRNLKKSGDDDWVTGKTPSGSDIFFRYTGTGLSPDFYFSASTETMISDTKENETVTMTVTVENFDGIEDNQYEICTKVDYAPWAKSVAFNSSPVEIGSWVEVSYDYMGDHVDKRLMHNGIAADTARSPYTALIDRPAVFSLEVFNQWGIRDTKQAFLDVLAPEILSFTADKSCFFKGEAVTLHWELHSVSNFSIDPIDKETGQGKEGSAIVYPVAFEGSRTAVYTLRANGYKNGVPASVSKSVALQQTMWENAGSQTGYFTGEVYGDMDYNSRIFPEEDGYYCYAHPDLYKSGDGLNWEKYASNDKADEAFICAAADCWDHVLYVMGKEGKEGRRLFIGRYDFRKGIWDYGPAYQAFCSAAGSFAFSKSVKAYTQVMENGLMISRCGEDGKWNKGGSAILAPGGKCVKGGDYCFYKNKFYAAILCDDAYVYVYDCDQSMEDVLYKKKVEEGGRFVNLIPTVNHLYIVTAGSVIDMKTGDVTNNFSPMGTEREKRMWIGKDRKECLIGIYPDRNLWKWEEE